MSETHNVPEEHSSEVGGSTAARRIGCPDSRELEKKAPKSRGSIYAREGTALHEMMAIILKQNKSDAEIDEMLPFTFTGEDRGHDGAVLEEWSHTIDADTWANVGAPALAMWEDFAEDIETSEDAEMRMMIEVKGAFPGIPGAFGTSDIVWRCGKLAGCWDWKFGRTLVSASDNKQLKFYMNTAIYESPDFFAGVEEYVLCISQPLVNESEHSEDVVTADDLTDFRNELIEAMSATGMAEGPWCKFADCALICPLKTRKTARLGQLIDQMKAVENGGVDDGGTPLADTFDLQEFLLEALDLIDAAQEWSSKVAGIAHQMLDEDRLTLPGWKVVGKKSSGKDWTVDDDKARGLLARRGLKIDDYAPRKTITVPAALKKLKAVGKELPETSYVARYPVGTTLVREGDPRAAARTPAVRAAELAAQMAKMAAPVTETKTESDE